MEVRKCDGSFEEFNPNKVKKVYKKPILWLVSERTLSK